MTTQERADRSLEDIVAHVALQDRQAFFDLYDRTSAKLFGVALRILGRDAEAEDALQEAYTKIWRNASRYRPDKAAPMTWMITITRNTSIDMLRRRREMTGHDHAKDMRPDHRPSPEQVVSLQSEVRQLEDCLDTLDTEKKELIQAAYFTGQTYTEIAEATNTPLGTIKSWMRRSLQKLRSCIDAATGQTEGRQA